MAVYIVRRLVGAFFILIGASFIVYMLMTQSGDPLAFTIEITNPTQRASVINTVTETLSLDVPPVQRYLEWLRRLLFEGDFGLVSDTQQPVWDELKLRIPLTIKLISAATITSVVVGVCVGVVTALRQYSGFDYLVTFFTFVFFALPVFWVAVILKSWGGINFNDWLRDGAHFSVAFIVIMAIVGFVIGSSFAGGRWPRRAVIGGSCGGRGRRPPRRGSRARSGCSTRASARSSTPCSVLGIAVGVVAVMAGWRNKNARNTALVTAAIGIILYFPLQTVFDRDISLWTIVGLGVIAILVGSRRGLCHGRLRQGPVGAHGGGDRLPDGRCSCSSTGRCSRGRSTPRRR